MTTEITIIVEDGMVSEVWGTAGRDVVVNVIDLDATDPDYHKEALEQAEEIRRDPDFENYC